MTAASAPVTSRAINGFDNQALFTRQNPALALNYLVLRDWPLFAFGRKIQNAIVA